MDDETIQQDVSPDVEGQEPEAQAEPPKGPRNIREDRMADVARKAAELREEETRAWREMNGTPEPVSEETDPDGPASEDEPEELAPAAEATDGDAEELPSDEHAGSPTGEEQQTGWYNREDGTRVKRLKVNGEIKELTEEQYDRAISKELAGDQKLRLAAEYQRKLEEREARLQQMEQQSAQPRELPQGQSAEALQSHLKKYHDAIYEGDTDAASTIMQEILDSAGRQTSTPNIEALVDQAATRARQSIEEERQTASVNRGWERLQQDFPALVNDDANLAYADAILKSVRAENPQWEPEQVILETGRRASEKLGLSKKAAQDERPAQSSQTVSRMERKAQLKPIPKGSTTAHKPKQEPQMDMSPAAKIARLRAGRAV